MSSFNYGFQSGQGFNPYLLRHIKDVVGTGNAPELKIDNIGFLALLKNQKNTIKLNNVSAPGGIQYAQVKYLTRLGIGNTSTNDSCDTGIVNAYKEVAVPLNIFRQIPLYLEQALVSEYTDDCIRTQSLGLPPTAIMGEMMNQINAAANAILTGIDVDLQAQIVVGTNPSTGSNASTTINITQNTVNLPLNDGMTRVLAETIKAEFAPGKPQVVGNGLALNYFQQQRAKGLAQSGLNTVIEAGDMDFYYDQFTQTSLGANEMLVISPESMQLVEFDRYVGPTFAGMHGTSQFGTFVLPMQIGTNLNKVDVSFDFQLRYIDCPSGVAELSDYYGSPLSGFRGYQMIISKTCGLFQVPTTQAYQPGDFMAGSNGVLRYTLTNI
jgi:hypothetical protein